MDVILPESTNVKIVCMFFKIVLENLSRGEDYECPFARASIALVKMLCEILEINGDPSKCIQKDV